MNEKSEIMKCSTESVMPDDSNTIDIRDMGICKECQDKVVKAILGIKKDQE